MLEELPLRMRTAAIPGHAEVVAIFLGHGAGWESFGMVDALKIAAEAGYQNAVEPLAG